MVFHHDTHLKPARPPFHLRSLLKFGMILNYSIQLHVSLFNSWYYLIHEYRQQKGEIPENDNIEGPQGVPFPKYEKWLGHLIQEKDNSTVFLSQFPGYHIESILPPNLNQDQIQTAENVN